jgi:hypothetical protein
MMWKETAVAKFKVMFRPLTEETKKYHGFSQDN